MPVMVMETAIRAVIEMEHNQTDRKWMKYAIAKHSYTQRNLDRLIKTRRNKIPLKSMYNLTKWFKEHPSK